MGDSCVLLLGDETRGVCNSTLKCIPHCGTAGTRRCSSTITQLCESSGFWKSGLDCSKTVTASTCDATAANGCRYCTEGAMQCTNSSAFSGVSGISKCNLGEWQTTTSCSAPSSCDQNLLNLGFGYCRVCTEGAKQCSSDLKSVQTCINGAWSTASCGSHQCMSMQSSVTCRVCTEGTKQCSSDSKSLQTCTNGAWSTTTCGYCDAASTQCGSCKPGTLQCPYKGAYLLQCNNQLQWYQTQSRC